MASRLHGVSISATQMAPKAAPSYKKTSGIRAPLTVDESDFEYSVSSKSHRNSTTSSYYSGSELESEGFESGEDERETVSERPHVVGQDEEILEEAHFVKEFAFSEPSVGEFNGERVEASSGNEHGFLRPFVRSPDEGFGQESGNDGGKAVFRPSVRIPDGRIYEGISSVGDSDDSGSFLSESGDELIGDESRVISYGESRPLVAVMDEEVMGSRPSPVVGVKIPLVQKLHIPIAQISADSDDDSQGSGVLDDGGFSGIARIPSIEVLHRINSAPKVRVLEDDEGDDNELQAENIAEMEFLEDLVTTNVVLEPSDEKEHIGVENSIHCFISADMIQDKSADIDKGATANSLVVNEEFDSISESGEKGDFVHSGEKIQLTDVINDREKCVELVDHRELTDLVGCMLFPENALDVSSAAERGTLCGKVMEPEVPELESNFWAASLDDRATKNSNTGLEDNLVFSLDNEVESESVQEVVPTVESFSSNDVHEISSVRQCVDIREVPAEGCPRFAESPKALAESMQVYMSDSLSKDASRTGVINANQSVPKGSKLGQETRKEAENSDWLHGEVEQLTFHADTKAVKVTEMYMLQNSSSFSNKEILLDHSHEIDDQTVTDFHDEVDADGGISDHGQIIDPAVLASFSEALRGAVSDDGVSKLTSIDGMEDLSLESNLDDLDSFSSESPIIAARNSDAFVPPSTNGELEEALSEKEKKKIEKIQQIRVTYLHLLHRFGLSSEDSVASKVLYQMTLAEKSFCSRAFHLDSANDAAMKLEAQANDDLDFSLCILVIGKTGVGKSATINSIFGERKAVIDAFEPATTHVKEIIGTINGVKLKVYDTPGLRTSFIDQSINRKILSSVKKLMQKSPPDVILYVDRLDNQTCDLDDLPVLKSVTSYLGSSIWRKSIVAFTHGISIPPDGPNGYPLSHKVFFAQQSRVIQQLISHLAPGLMIPVCLVENHPLAEKNEHGETLLHNGESWRSKLLLLFYSMKTLSELSSVVTVQNPLDHRKRRPVLSYFLSSFLQSNVRHKFWNDQSGESVVSDADLCYSSDSDQEDDAEYDNLLPSKPLNKSQVAKLSREQRKRYLEEYDYHIKLFQKKQLGEEIRQFGNLTELRNGAGNETYMEGVVDEETGAPETAAVPLSDMALPPFGGDNPSFRYRDLEPSSWLLTRPVLGSHGWDHDCGYDGVLVEDKINAADHFPAVMLVQLNKDNKREFSIQLHSSVSAKYRDKAFGKKLAYTLKGKAKLRNFRKNATAAGFSIVLVEEEVVSGLKVEDHIAVGKRLRLVGNAGIIRSQDDAAYGVNLDLCTRDEDYPVDQDQTSLGLSVMRYRRDVICCCNMQSQFSIGMKSKLNVTAALNNKLSGRISIKTSSTDQLQIAVLAFIPIARAVFKKFFRQSAEDYSA